MSKSIWAQRHQSMYGGGVIIILLVIFIPTIFFVTYAPATCFDGKRNQGETAVDRGGPCKLMDARFVQKTAILWSRTFPVRNGFYNAVAYVENVNKDAGTPAVTYRFRLYDKDNILVAERVGRTPVYPGKVFPVFEGLIDAGTRVPVRVSFSFVDPIVWERMQDTTRGLVVFNKKISNLESSPRVDAEVKNTTLQQYRNVVLVATLFDGSGNAVNASRTLISNIGPDSILPIAFTWPKKFKQNATSVDIVPLLVSSR